MARFLKNMDANRGMSPGSLVFIGKQKVQEQRVHLIDYDMDILNERPLPCIKDGEPFLNGPTVTWIDVDGIHDIEVVREAGKLCNLHPLLMEDILNTGQRPKLEEFDNCIFLVIKLLTYDSEKRRIQSEQVSMVLGETYLLTFQEIPGDSFDPVRERIRKQKGRVRNSGSDYLAYCLMDTEVDNYISIIERLGEQIEDLEEEMLADVTSEIMERIHRYKREMNYLSKTIRPVREMVLKLIHIDNPLIRETTLPFLKDLLDLASEATEAIEIYRDMLTDMMNLYNSFINNKMNDIMKVLTIFAAIFIPLTFIAGVYGTNFEHIPELHYRYGYYVFLGVLAVIGVGMVVYFKRKRWI